MAKKNSLRTYCEGQNRKPHKIETHPIYGFLDIHLDNPLLDADLLASELNMSPRTLSRKLATLVAMTPGELIRTYRLRKAVQLLQSGLSPTETAYRVGFGNPSSFSRTFRAVYQKTPSEFMR